MSFARQRILLNKISLKTAFSFFHSTASAPAEAAWIFMAQENASNFLSVAREMESRVTENGLSHAWNLVAFSSIRKIENEILLVSILHFPKPKGSKIVLETVERNLVQ